MSEPCINVYADNMLIYQAHDAEYLVTDDGCLEIEHNGKTVAVFNAIGWDYFMMNEAEVAK